MADTEAMADLAQQVLAQFGRLDALVNNAGITQDAVALMTREQWDSVILTNLGGLYNATRPLVLPMVKQGAGSIVNLSSLVAIYGYRGQTNLAATKGGVIGFTKALSAEVAPRAVRVNAVAPGYIRTDMISVMDADTVAYVESRIALGRQDTVDEVAPLVCFLASDLSSHITGQIIHVDGGITR